MIALVWLFLAATDIKISDGHQHSKGLLLREAMETVVLPGVYPTCSIMDFENEYFTCQIRDLSDDKHLKCFCHEECTQNEQRRVISCPDGSIQKTCVKVKEEDEYLCACQSAPRTFYQGSEQFHWASDWDPTIPDIENGNVFHRRLCHDDGGEVQCIVEEKIHLHYLVAHLDISDNAITASTYHINSNLHRPERVRLGHYTSRCCGWIAWVDTDLSPWVQFDMGVAVTAWGLLLKARCDAPWNHQKVLSCDVTFSHDGNAWMTAAKDVTAPYPDGSTSVVWFQHPVSGRYWRIHPLTWEESPAMKADLIGR